MRSARRALVALTLALLPAGCKSDPCAEISCAAPQTCDALTGACRSLCDQIKCSVGEVCEEGTGTCREASPAMPPIGALVDRVGRPLVGTVLLNPFDQLVVDGGAQDGDVTRGAYNADGDPRGWRERWGGAIAASLAILDALDGVCGNNLAADATAPRYSALGGVLADDQLYLDIGNGVCKDVYFAVEGKALGLAGSDCGGRTLRADVVDATYSIAAASSATGVSDGVASGANLAGSFPFLGSPRD